MWGAWNGVGVVVAALEKALLNGADEGDDHLGWAAELTGFEIDEAMADADEGDHVDVEAFVEVVGRHIEPFATIRRHYGGVVVDDVDARRLGEDLGDELVYVAAVGHHVHQGPTRSAA